MGLAASEIFGIGTMDDSFQECGKTLVLMLKLMIMATGLATLSGVSLSIRPEMLSGPEALEVSRDFSKINISWSVQRKSSGQSWLLLSITLADSGANLVISKLESVQYVGFV